MNVRIDLSEAKAMLAAAEECMSTDYGRDSAGALAWATMANVAYTIAAAEAAMRVVDEMLAEQAAAHEAIRTGPSSVFR